MILWLVLASAAAAEAPTWPAPGAALQPFEVSPLEAPLRVYVDPGHGAPGNEGAQTVRCEPEQGINLRVSRHLAQRLSAQGFEVRLSRTDHDGPAYPARLAEAEAWGADVFLSIHADTRGTALPWSPEDGTECLRNDAEPGFSVLFSEEGAGSLVTGRRTLARDLAEKLAGLGLPAYDGADYAGLYAPDDTAGVFRDRRGLMMLRRPVMPSVIIETHHARHLEEWERWQEEDTWEAFATAVARALTRSRTD